MHIHRLPDGLVRQLFRLRKPRALHRLATAGSKGSIIKIAKKISASPPAALALAVGLGFTSAPVFAARDSAPRIALVGYRAVPVHYTPLNKMIMSVRINGQLVNLLVDTGSNQLMLDADVAQSLGLRPSQRGLYYIRFTEIQGQLLPVGYADSVTAGDMNFGSNLIVLRNPSRSGAERSHVDGVLGLDILLRHKAVINCRSRLVFFKVDQRRRTNLAAIAGSENFVRVPLDRAQNGALTVPCSVNGRIGRLAVDTGAFVTTFDESFIESLHIPSEPTRLVARFPNRVERKIRVANIDDLKIGRFKVSAKKFGVAGLPYFVLWQGGTKISGILGLDTLYNSQAIIDLDGMDLFLK